MTNDEIFIKNNILQCEFSKYLLEHPDVGDQIPFNAQVVLLPQDDPELCKKNIEITKAQRETGQAVVYVYIDKLAPQMSRIVNPQIKIEAA